MRDVFGRILRLVGFVYMHIENSESRRWFISLLSIFY